MGVIASAELDLNVVNDAYTVSLSNPVCAIHADYDGSNPQLTNAVTTITVSKGDTLVRFDVEIVGQSSSDIAVLDSYNVDMDKWTLRLNSIPTDALEGYVQLKLSTDDNWNTTIEWRYIVVRESTMLDWIQDWESNKTKVGNTYVITPKIFVGQKITLQEDGWIDTQVLTGVYIGPDSIVNGTSSVGIYGYKLGKEIFHLNETGGSIGGWQIENGGIQTSDGTLKILAEGTIEARNADQDLMWAIYKSGDAIFAKGNVKLNADGTASFTGTINAADGNIGGWTIGSTTINNGHIGLDAVTGVIGIAAGDIVTTLTVPNYLSSIETNGGVMLYYTNANKYGLVGYNKTTDGTVKVLSVGSTNLIAGWNFDNTSLYHVEKVNATRSYTSETGSITIGTAGLRGTSWYIDNDGVASFAKGLVTFSSTSSSIVGWNLNANRLSTSHIALVSEAGAYGLYISSNTNLDFNSIASANLGDSIDSGGGIYIKTNDDHASLAAYNSEGKKIFKLRSNGVNSIAGWNFDDATLYSGTAQDTAGSYTLQSSDITIGTNGLRGYKWRLEADGSGAVGGGHAYWDAKGNVTLDETVTLSASSIKSGTIDATIINSDTIIANGESWALNKDGSGYLANKNISWDSEGNLTVTEISAVKGSIGSIQIYSDHIGVTSSASESGTTAAWAALTIYKDFFKVGGAKGYVLFGNDVIPASAGGAFTATGRIVNQAPNTYGSYGFDQANYGLFIDVSGGTKNYGISSNAALMAPSFINTKAQLLTFSGSTYSVDFSQRNIILMSASSAASVTLPTEAQVAYKFGLSSLPDDFATVVIFKVREGSSKIILNGLYNNNESSTNVDMQQGDTLMVLITKCDGFRYQILSHYN